MFASCGGDDREDEPVATTEDVELYFNALDNSALDVNTIRNYVGKSTVNSVYLVPDQKFNWKSVNSADLHDLRSFLQQRLSLSSKVRARGTLNLTPGVASQTEEDSLWYAQQGWIINGPAIEPDPSEWPDTLEINPTPPPTPSDSIK